MKIKDMLDSITFEEAKKKITIKEIHLVRTNETNLLSYVLKEILFLLEKKNHKDHLY